MASVSQITVDNQGFSAFRTAMNNSLNALNTLSSASSAPGSKAAGSLWLDTTSATTPTLKFYDGSDWISLCTFNYSANTVNWLDSTVSLGADSVDSDQYVDGSIDNIHLADNAVDTEEIADNAVSLAKMAGGTDGNIISYDASGDPVAIATGTDGQVLTSAGAGQPPAFAAGGGDKNYKNILINGDMAVAQRATSTASITTSDGYYACDRWKTQTDTGTWTISQSTDVPSGQGFYYSMKLDCTSAGSSNGDEIALMQKFEGQMLQHLKFGTASAESLSLSFWIKTNETGTYSAILFNANSDQERIASFDYTVSSADTWEKKTITFPGDTSRIIKNTNTEEFSVKLYFGTPNGSGVTNTWQNSAVGYWSSGNLAGLGGSTDDEVYITGIQLEVGTSSDFEFLPVGVNLGRCQRYYHQIYSRSGTQAYSDVLDLANCTDYDGGQLFCMKDLPTTMRSIPSIVQTTGTDYLLALRNGAQDTFDGFNGVGKAGYNNIAIFTSGAENYVGSAGASARVRCNDASYKLAASAEL